MDVSTLIVNYNSTHYLKDCLESLTTNTNNLDYEIIVVDNKSTDRDIEKLAASFPGTKFVFRGVNDGFGAACNHGFKISKGKYICLVNPDIVVKNNILKDYYDLLEANPEIICCAPLQIDENGDLTNSFNVFPSVLSEFKESFNIGVESHLTTLLQRKEINEKKIFEVDYHIGAFVFLTREAYISINGFDERFFLYSEDIDFGLRLKKLGKKVVCTPDQTVYHYVSCTVKSPKGMIVRTYHIARSKMIYFYKHFNFIERNSIRLFLICGSLLRLLYIPFNRVHKGQKINGLKRNLKGMSVYLKRYNLSKLHKFYRTKDEN